MSDWEIEIEKKKLLKDPKAKAILQKMLENSAFKISPSIDLKGINYPLAQEALPESSNAEIKYLLGVLAKFGILEVKFLDKFVTCPSCGSPSVISRYNCPRCKSIDVSRHSIISHTECGFTESKADFEVNTAFEDELVCPHCDKKLTASDYKEVGVMFKCNTCGSKFQAPNTSHKCTMCNVTFTHRDAGYEPIFEFQLSESAKREISSSDAFMAEVVDVFSKRGFSVALKSTVQGKSGADHNFDLVARSGNDVIVANIAFKVREDDIIGFFAKKYDVDPSLAILISLSPPQSEHLLISQIYGIHVVFATESHTVGEQVADLLDYDAQAIARESTEDETTEETEYEPNGSFM